MARFQTGTYTIERETDDATIEITVSFTVSGQYRPQRACPVNGIEPAEYPEVEIDQARGPNGQLVELTEDEIERVEDHALNDSDDEDDDGRGDYAVGLWKDARMDRGDW